MELAKHETCKEYLKRRLGEGWKCISLEGYDAVILSPDGFERALDLRHDIATLVPNSDIEANLSYIAGSADHWDNVDTDDEATYNGSYAYTTYERDLYGLSGKPGNVDTVTSVEIFAKIISTSSTPNQYSFKYAIRTNGTVTEVELEELVDKDNGWVSRSHKWTTDPDGGGAFTAADIANLVCGFLARSAKSGFTLPTECCYFYVEVDYTPSAVTFIPTVTII